jgi:hypothetical protein
MKSPIQRMILCFSATFLAIGATSLAAYECDEVHVLDNEQGLLSLEGYIFGNGTGDMRTLRAPLTNLGLCDSWINITAPNSRLPVGLKDDQVSRRILNNQPITDWDTNAPAIGFASRFQIEPQFDEYELSRSAHLTFRRLTFTSPNPSSAETVNLDFTLTATDSGSAWRLGATMLSPADGINHDISLGVVGPKYGPARRIEVLFEFVYSQIPGQSKMRISILDDGIDKALWVAPVVGAMQLKRQAQGVLDIGSIDEGREFRIDNCLPSMCFRPLDGK